MARTDSVQPALIANKKFDDIVSWSETKCYFYKVTRQDQDISVQLNLYSGMASLMARAGDTPINEEDAHFVTSTSSYA